MADVTQTDPSKLIAPIKTSAVCIKKTLRSLRRTQLYRNKRCISTKELHSTLLEMKNSTKLLYNEVKFLGTEAVLKSEVDESVYKTPTTMTSELKVAEESLAMYNTLTIATSKNQSTTEL